MILIKMTCEWLIFNKYKEIEIEDEVKIVLSSFQKYNKYIQRTLFMFDSFTYHTNENNDCYHYFIVHLPLTQIVPNEIS